MKKSDSFTPSFEYELRYAHDVFVNTKRTVLIAGMDEVGRGSIAGPVAVGVAIRRFTIDELTSDRQTVLAQLNAQMVSGLQDSKILTPSKRVHLSPLLQDWLPVKVGMASASEVDEWGILGALRMASRRALALLANVGLYPDVIILDGMHDWFAWPAIDLWQSQNIDSICFEHMRDLQSDLPAPLVHCIVKGDQKSALVAASSVVAKVSRDTYMQQLAKIYPGYDFEHCMGYASKRHINAIKNLGVCPEHRVSWKIPGI